MNYIYEENRIFANNEEGKLVAEITFRHIEEDVIDIDHTFVDSSLRGQGIANQLMLEVNKLLHEKNWKAVPTCSYAVRWAEDKTHDTTHFLKK